jgi:hypothetical protein
VLENSHATLRSNFQPSTYGAASVDNEDFSFEGVYGSHQPTHSSPQKNSYSSGPATGSSLIDALVPLNIFLHTDCVKIHIPSSHSPKEEVIMQQINYDPTSTSSSMTDPTVSDWKIVINSKLIEPFPPTPQLIHDYMDFLGEPGLSRPKFFPPFPEFRLEDPKTYSDEEIIEAGLSSLPLIHPHVTVSLSFPLLVRSGNFEVSMYTPISSLLQIWSVASADYISDHVCLPPHVGLTHSLGPEPNNSRGQWFRE